LVEFMDFVLAITKENSRRGTKKRKEEEERKKTRWKKLSRNGEERAAVPF
jgi:hypothetical protein